MSHHWGNANGPPHLGHTQGQDSVNPGARYAGVQYESVGYAGTTGLSGADKVQREVDNLATFFGEPSSFAKLQIKDLKDRQARSYEPEHLDYSDLFSKAYGGGDAGARNDYLSQVMLEKTRASENWQMRMAPWHDNASQSNEFAWMKMVFNKHMLDREPEEAVPRLLSFTRQGGSAALLRFGLGMMLECTFASTPTGRRYFAMHIEQLRVGTVETASYGVMIAILEHEPYEQPRMDKGARGIQSFTRTFRDEADAFGIVNKSRNGYDTLRGEMMRQLSAQGAGTSGDFTVVPMGMAQYVARSMDNKYYLDGESDRRWGIPQIGQHVVESRLFTQGPHERGHDPMYRHQTIGGFMTLDDLAAASVDVGGYRTSDMDTLGYDEGADEFYTFEYAHVYQKTGAWNFKLQGAPLTEGIGQGMVQDLACYTWGQVYAQYSDNLTRAVDKLATLTPDKQALFHQSISLLMPNDHERLTVGANGMPTYDHKKMLGMVGGKFDRSQATVAEIQEASAKRSRATFGIAGTSAPSAGAARIILDDEEEEKTGSTYIVDEMQDISDSEVLPEETITDPVTGEERTYAARRPITRRRRVTARRRTTGIGGAPAVLPIDIARDIIAACANRPVQAVDAHAFTATRDADAAMAKWMTTYTDTLMTMPGIDESQSRAMLTELRRIVTHETERVRASPPVAVLPSGDLAADARAAVPLTLDHLKKIVAVSFTTYLASRQTRILANALSEERSTLELAAAADAEADLAVVQARTPDNTPGWWNPHPEDPFENGQLSLVVAGGVKGTSLPHDAYAATLTAGYNVLFKLPGDVAKDLTNPAPVAPATKPFVDVANDRVLKPGLHQSRLDAFVWSIALSAIMSEGATFRQPAAAGAPFTGVIRSDAFAAWVRAIKKDNPSVWRRLVREVDGVRAVLPSQLAFLEPSVTGANNLLAAAVRHLETGAAAGTDGAAFNALAAALPLVRNFIAVEKNAYENVRKSGYVVPAGATAPTSALHAELTLALVGTPFAGQPDAINAAVNATRAVFRANPRPIPPEQWKQNFDTWADAFCTQVITGTGPVATGVLADLNMRNGVKDMRRLGRYDQLFTVLQTYFLAKDKRGTANPKNATTLVPGDSLPPMAWNKANIREFLRRAANTNGGLFRFCVENNIPVPFAVRLWRPWKIYNMGSMIRMVSGRNGAARTFYMMPNFVRRARAHGWDGCACVTVC
jgi:hypothetical protein